MSYECKELTIAAARSAGVAPSGHGCKECLESGDEWVHLRLCLSCGHVGCCDSSQNQHATKHHRHTHHPVILSFEPGEKWAWCYLHETVADPFTTFPNEVTKVHYDAP